MTLTAVKLDGARVVSYRCSSVRLLDVPMQWLKLRRKGFYMRFEIG